MGQLFLGKEITINTRCLESGQPIRVRMKGWDVAEVSPDEAVGYTGTPLDQWGKPTWAFT